MNLPELRFDPASGLIAAVVQSADDGTVLMLGWMNRESLALTLDRGRVTFWSRSRNELWEKGSTSGNWLELVSIASDCDHDALLVTARPHGPTCHTGRDGCFGAGAAVATPSRQAGLGAALARLETRVAQRRDARPENSYTLSLLDAGTARIAQKVGEEAIETALAAVGDPVRLVSESADLLYHLLVLWQAAGVSTDEVASELAGREGTPGIDDGGGANARRGPSS